MKWRIPYSACKFMTHIHSFIISHMGMVILS